MNDVFDPQSVNEPQRWVDRLVDGELSHDDQRKLILSLEAQPDGWRRCALAFLESQAWGREFQHLTCDASPAISLSATKISPVANGTRNLLRALTFAAGILVAFTLGVASRGVLPLDTVDTQAPTQDRATRAIASTSPVGTKASANARRSAKFETVKLTIPTDDGVAEQTVELPLIEGDEDALASLLSEQQPVLSELELKTLESTGHYVEQRRAYYPVRLQDGRQAVLPMDLVEVQYTGGWQ